jgi:recombination protein U
MNSGKIFEKNFKASIPQDVFYYRLRDSTASFYGGGDGSNIRFQQSNMADCIIFGNRTLFICELKSHKGKSIPFNCIRKNQIEQLTAAAKFPFIIPALVIFFPDVERCFSVHINDWNNLVDASKKKSANIAEIEQAGFEVRTRKLKTNFRYDVAKMIDDLMGDLNDK